MVINARAFEKARIIGAIGEKNNLEVLCTILRAMGELEDVFEWLRDRPGHDRCYAIDATKLMTELGWHPDHTDFAAGLSDTIAWYSENRAWWEEGKALVEAGYAEKEQ